MKVAVVGLGIQGLKIAVEEASRGAEVWGIDSDPDKIEILQLGGSYSKQIAAHTVQVLVARGSLHLSDNLADVKNADTVLICLPVPIRHDGSAESDHLLARCREMAPFIRENAAVSFAIQDRRIVKRARQLLPGRRCERSNVERTADARGRRSEVGAMSGGSTRASRIDTLDCPARNNAVGESRLPESRQHTHTIQRQPYAFRPPCGLTVQSADKLTSSGKMDLEKKNQPSNSVAGWQISMIASISAL